MSKLFYERNTYNLQVQPRFRPAHANEAKRTQTRQTDAVPDNSVFDKNPKHVVEGKKNQAKEGRETQAGDTFQREERAWWRN